MIDRRFYGSEAVNPTYIVAGEYDTQTNAVRNVTGKPFSTPAHVTFKQFLNNYRRPGEVGGVFHECAARQYRASSTAHTRGCTRDCIPRTRHICVTPAPAR